MGAKVGIMGTFDYFTSLVGTTGTWTFKKIFINRNLDLSKFCIGQKEEQLPSYDLYAVINHYGGMIGGHYTACARLPNDRSSQRSDVGEGTCSQQDRW